MKKSESIQGESPSEPVRASSGGTETYLFTDIEGSTVLLQRLGDGYPDLLREQRRLLLAAIEGAGGREASNAGDGSFAVFPRARDAVLAAAAAQRALSAHPWPQGAAVAVRMGLHTGDAALAGTVYTGLDVYRAARISAAGHGGQVLLSETTRQLVERELAPGLALRDLGEHYLKDLHRSERIWQLVIEDLPSEFPTLKTLSTRPNNLPAQSTLFIGREQEIETVRQLLLRDSVRLVTLTGPGGIGKTRLALQAAAALVSNFTDGAFFVPLGTVADPSLIPERVVESLGLKEDRSRAAIDALKDHLRWRELLLVIDNFEQVVESASLVSHLLAECRKLKILVTSRIVLHLSGETEYPIPPLPVPDPKRSPGVAAIGEYAAIILFTQRAQSVQPDFVLTEENAPAIAQICAHLDGLPLAIELAAARIKLFSPQAMLARLGSRLDLLKGGARDLPLRQQTLRHAIAWSYDLLDPDERAYFRRLAVFRGGWSLQAVEPVANPSGDLELDSLDVVSALIDKSLVRRLDRDVAEPRFLMLETIQEYGIECLRSSGEEETIRRAHALHFLALAEQGEPELTTSQQGIWLDRLATEQDNFRAASDWAESRGEGEIGLRLGAALWRFWTARNHLGEGRAWLERLLSVPGAQVRTAERARALYGAGTLMHEISDYAASRPLLEEGLSIWRQLGDKKGIATLLNSLGWVAAITGDVSPAKALATESLALNRQLGNKRGTSLALHSLAWLALWGGDLARARSLYGEAIALRRDSGDRRGVAYQTVIVAWVDCIQGDYAAGEARVRDSLCVFRELGDRQLIAWGLHTQGKFLREQGNLAEARALLEESRTLWAEVGNRDSLSWSVLELADVLLGQGDPAGARVLAEEGWALAQKTLSRFTLSEARITMGWIALEMGETEDARNAFQEGLAFKLESQGLTFMPECFEGLATVHAAGGNTIPAARALGQAGTMRERIGAPLPPASRARHERVLADVRRALEDRVFSSAFEEGRVAALALFDVEQTPQDSVSPAGPGDARERSGNSV